MSAQVRAATISAIYGMEPGREGEYPMAHRVGQQSRWADGTLFTVSRIERREDNFGDHGLLWFDVFDGDKLAHSMQGRAVAEVHYERA